MLSSLEKSISATICYYDILDYPLTSFEIYKYFVNVDGLNQNHGSREHLLSAVGAVAPTYPKVGIDSPTYQEVIETLENSPELKKIISQKNGFYFLKGKSGIVKKHIWRKKISDGKWKKARRIIWLLQIIPFVKMIAVSGSLALGNSRKESDIDLLIVAKSGRIWICRTAVTFLTAIFGVRRYGNNTRDKICLNHYITDESLEIPFKSLYNAQSYARLVPVMEKQKFIFQKFQKANSWLKDYLIFLPDLNLERGYSRMPLSIKNLRTIKKSKILNIFAKFLEIILSGWIGNNFERILAKYEKARIEKDPLTKKPGGRITTDNTQLEFHPDSPEKRIIYGFNERMKEFDLCELACQKDSGLIK